MSEGPRFAVRQILYLNAIDQILPAIDECLPPPSFESVRLAAESGRFLEFLQEVLQGVADFSFIGPRYRKAINAEIKIQGPRPVSVCNSDAPPGREVEVGGLKRRLGERKVLVIGKDFYRSLGGELGGENANLDKGDDTLIRVLTDDAERT